MAEINVRGDNGIVALILGGLIVWLLYQFGIIGPGSGLENSAANAFNALTGATQGCKTQAPPVYQPITAEPIDYSGRFIPGFSGGAAGRGAPISNPVNTSYGFQYSNGQITGLLNQPTQFPA